MRIMEACSKPVRRAVNASSLSFGATEGEKEFMPGARSDLLL